MYFSSWDTLCRWYHIALTEKSCKKPRSGFNPQPRLKYSPWSLPEDVRVTIHNQFSVDKTYQATIRPGKGDAAVSIVQQPSSNNDFELQIIISSAGAADEKDNALSFDLFAEPADIVLITIDTLRADRLGCYGYNKPTSPNLDAFAQQCVLFEKAFSTSSFTPPAHASLFTSRYVKNHGLLTWNKRIIQEALDFVRMPLQHPFFLWLHLYDVHRPYGGPKRWREEQGLPRGAGDVEAHYGLRPEQVLEKGLNRDDVIFIADRYDDGIRYIDSELKPLLDLLSSPGRAKDTLVIITSDHVENLLECAETLFAHDPFLYSVVTRIPLLIRYPGHSGRGETCDALVSLIDLAPTILDLIGLYPPPFYEGLSLLPLLTDTDWPRNEIFHECWGWKKLKAVRAIDRLIIGDMQDDKSLFFDLTEDPQELHPAIEPQDEMFYDLYQKLII